MLVGPDESYRLDKRFSCTVNCETEKDRLWEFGGVGDGDGGGGAGGVGSRNDGGGERGLLVCRNRILQLAPVLFRRVFVTCFVLCRILNLKCVFIC